MPGVACVKFAMNCLCFLDPESSTIGPWGDLREQCRMKGLLIFARYEVREVIRNNSVDKLLRKVTIR